VFLEGLIKIDEAKLIYRFTCAKKFQIEDDCIKQLRLNSWGREYINGEGLLKIYGNVTKMFEDYFRQYYREI